MTVTVGVIGCGSISRFHFAGIEKYGARVKWVCDLNPAAAQPYAGKFSAAYTADYREILADPEVKAVFVNVISSLHKEMCLAAIQAGKAVICEKTLATNADDALEIVRLAEKKGTIFYTSYMKRFIPAVVKAKELMPSLETIFSTYIRTYQPWGPIWETTPTEGFFYTPPGGSSTVVKNYGGGVLVCGGSHILDLTVFFLGRPTRLFATMFTPEGRDYDLLASALMQTSNGVVHWEAAGHPLTRIGFHRDGWDKRIEINGTRGRLEILSAKWDEVFHKDSLLIHYDNTSGAVTEYRYSPGSPFDRAVAFFLSNIEQGTQGTQSRLTGYDVDELIAHINLSARTGKAVDIDWRIR